MVSDYLAMNRCGRRLYPLSLVLVVMVGARALSAQEHNSVPVTINSCAADPSNDMDPTVHTYSTTIPPHAGRPDYLMWTAVDKKYTIIPVPGQPWPFKRSKYIVKPGYPAKGVIDSATQKRCSTSVGCTFHYLLKECGRVPGPTPFQFIMHVKG